MTHDEPAHYDRGEYEFKTTNTMKDEKNTSAKVDSKIKSSGLQPPATQLFTTEEKAQYEVFKNGKLPRETIQEWIGNDLRAIVSFANGILKDERVLTALVDAFYARYTALHSKDDDNEPTQIK